MINTMVGLKSATPTIALLLKDCRRRGSGGYRALLLEEGSTIDYGGRSDLPLGERWYNCGGRSDLGRGGATNSQWERSNAVVEITCFYRGSEAQ